MKIAIMLIIKEILKIICLLNFSVAIFVLTKFNNVLKCYQERWRD